MNMDKRHAPLKNWFVETRLSWIKESIEIFGFINREHIRKKFGVSTPQASLDLREAMKRWPGMLAYDMKMKRYIDRTSLLRSDGK